MSKNAFAQVDSVRFREIVDGVDRSAAARLIRFAATLVSIPYSLCVRTRNRLYDLGFLAETRVARPTISVGNLTLGGVGKTPFVAKIAERLLQEGLQPGIVSRGYKAKEQASRLPSESSDALNRFARYQVFNDEARELQLRLPSVPHFSGARRVEVANALIDARPEIDAIILDDAHQHRRIARDFNALLLDALDPFGGGRIFPAGFLREPLSGAARADAIVLNRADLIGPDEREKIKKRALQFAPNAIWAEIVQKPNIVYQLVESDGRPDGVNAIRFDAASWQNAKRDARIMAFCGLGAPSGFKKTLEKVGLNVVSFCQFPDHCVYSRQDKERILKEARNTGAELLLATLKDLVKFDRADLDCLPLYALGIDVEFLAGEEALYEALHDKTNLKRASDV